MKSLPKKKLINFLQNAELDKDYSFDVNIPLDKALDFVHRMRVELSRFREKVRARKRVPKHFKMLYVGAVAKGNNNCTITLKRSLSGHDVSGAIDDIFDEVAGGEKIDV